LARQSPVGQSLLIHEVSRSHTTMHHSQYDSSERVFSSSHRPLPDNTQHSQQTDIHAAGGIGTHNLNRQAAADLRLRPCGHWDWQNYGVDEGENIKGVSLQGEVFIKIVVSAVPTAFLPYVNRKLGMEPLVGAKTVNVLL